MLEPTHTVVPVSKEEATPHTPNIYEQPRCVFPQLPPYLDSPGYFIQPNGTPGCGMVYDANLQQWQAPTPYELERALGLQIGITAHKMIDQPTRVQFLGHCMDDRITTFLARLHLGLTT